jgi:hypothetical protein
MITHDRDSIGHDRTMITPDRDSIGHDRTMITPDRDSIGHDRTMITPDRDLGVSAGAGLASASSSRVRLVRL